MPRKNVCNIIGHVGGDAEQRDAGGTPVVSWSVGVSSFRKGGETQWFRCSWFGDRAVKVQQYIRKGDAIDVTGEVTLRTWQKDGQPRSNLELRVNDVVLLGGKGSGGRSDPGAYEPPKHAPDREVPDDDDIPF